MMSLEVFTHFKYFPLKRTKTIPLRARKKIKRNYSVNNIVIYYRFAKKKICWCVQNIFQPQQQ